MAPMSRGETRSLAGRVTQRGRLAKSRPEGRLSHSFLQAALPYACNERTDISPSPRDRMAAMAAMLAAAVVKYGILS